MEYIPAGRRQYIAIHRCRSPLDIEARIRDGIWKFIIALDNRGQRASHYKIVSCHKIEREFASRIIGARERRRDKGQEIYFPLASQYQCMLKIRGRTTHHIRLPDVIGVPQIMSSSSSICLPFIHTQRLRTISNLARASYNKVELRSYWGKRFSFFRNEWNIIVVSLNEQISCEWIIRTEKFR